MIQKTYRKLFVGLAGLPLVPLWLASVTIQGFGAEEPAPAATEAVKPAPEEFNVLRYGIFDVRPFMLVGVLWDDNIRIRSTNEQRDVVWTISPGLQIGAGAYRDQSGNYVSLDYRPDIIRYSRHDEHDSLDHLVNFQAQRKWDKLTLGVGQAYQAGSGGFTEALNRVERAIYVTTLRGAYQYSDKTSFEVIGRQNISDYSPQLNSYNEWVNQNWVNYQWTPKVTVGGGFTIGYRDIQGSANQTYEQVLLRAFYTMTDKLKANGSLGVELQQYQRGGDRGPIFVFSLGGTYTPRDRTSIMLEAYRREQNSVVLTDQNYTATGISGSVRQQVWDRLSVNVTGGYEEGSYHATGAAGAGPKRTDKYFYVGPGIDYSITQRWLIGVFYQHRENSSSVAAFDFVNNQAGLRTSFRY
jgi:hypothetical protein